MNTTSEDELRKVYDEFMAWLQKRCDEYEDEHRKNAYMAGYLSVVVQNMVLCSDTESAASFLRNSHPRLFK